MAKVKMTPSETIVVEGVDHVSGIVGLAFMDMLDCRPLRSSNKQMPIDEEERGSACLG